MGDIQRLNRFLASAKPSATYKMIPRAAACGAMVRILNAGDRLRLMFIDSASLIDERGCVVEEDLAQVVQQLRLERDHGQVIVAFDDLDCMSIQATKSLSAARIRSPAFAALRQTRLLSSWSMCLDLEGVLGGQVLLDRGVLDDPARAFQLRATFDQLFSAGVVPIVGYACTSCAVGERATTACTLDSGLIALLSSTCEGRQSLPRGMLGDLPA